jgi:hypothetical protein
MTSFSKYAESRDGNIEEGFWGNLGNAAVDAGKQIWQGVQNAGTAGKQAMVGPKAKYDATVSAVQGLKASFDSNPAFKQFFAQVGSKLPEQIDALATELQRIAPQIPKLSQFTQQAVSNAQGQQNTTGGAPQQPQTPQTAQAPQQPQTPQTQQQP